MGRQAVRRAWSAYHLNLLDRGARDRRSTAQGLRRGARRGRGVRDISAGRLRLLPRDGDAATERSATALLDSPVGLAAWLLDHDTDSYYKISRAFVDGEARREPHPRQRHRQHHAVLADRHRRVGRPVVLGGRTSAGRGAGEGPRSSAGARFPSVSRRSRARSGRTPRSWAEIVYPGLAYFHKVDRGGHFAAWEEPRALRHRGARGVPLGARVR